MRRRRAPNSNEKRELTELHSGNARLRTDGWTWTTGVGELRPSVIPDRRMSSESSILI